MADETKEKAGDTDHVRVICARPNAATCINGVRFGVVDRPEKAPPVLVSEPIATEVAERFCRGKGFAPFDAAAFPKKALVDADAQIAAERAAAADTATGGKGGAVVGLERQLTELQKANQRQSAELQKARQERDAAVQRLQDSSVPKLEAQVKHLADEVIEKDAAIKTLQQENADLRRINAELAKTDEKPARTSKAA